MDGNQAYRGYVERLRAQHGARFDETSLAPTFRHLFGRRVEVQFSCGTVKRGYISGTTGWRPSLMLMLRRNSRGSSWLLSEKDKLLQVLPGERFA